MISVSDVSAAAEYFMKIEIKSKLGRSERDGKARIHLISNNSQNLTSNSNLYFPVAGGEGESLASNDNVDLCT